MALHFKPFATESYSGGGSFFNDGLYRVATSRWVMFDFKGSAPGKDGNGIPCLGLTLQPVNKDGKDVGDEVTQYWSIGTNDAEVHDNGKDLELTGEFETIWKLSDCGTFMAHLKDEAKFDFSSVEEEGIIALENNIFEFGKVVSPRTQTKKSDDESGKKKPENRIIVPVKHIGAVGASSKSSKSKDKGGKSSAPATSGDADHETLLQEYLVEKVLTDKNKKGIDKLQALMGLTKYLQQEKKSDEATVKAVQAMFKGSKLGEILTSVGWTLAGSTIKAEED